MIEEGIGEYANPESILRAAVMLLSHIGLQAASDRLKAALDTCSETERRVVVTGDRDGATCAAYADYVMEKLV
jgi:isocitrate dehydrogenase (NAD+)